MYYFDTSGARQQSTDASYPPPLGDFQELGKERKRAPMPVNPPMKRVKRVVDRWVYGPSAKHQLEEGESELVTKVVWVSVPAW